MLIDKLKEHNIECFNFVDIVLDYMLFDGCEQILNSLLRLPMLAIPIQQEISSDQESTRFSNIKRSNWASSNKLLEHYLDVLKFIINQANMIDLGTFIVLPNYAAIEMFKNTFSDYFSFRRVRYTNYEDLCNDILSVTKERELEMQTRAGYIS